MPREGQTRISLTIGMLASSNNLGSLLGRIATRHIVVEGEYRCLVQLDYSCYCLSVRRVLLVVCELIGSMSQNVSWMCHMVSSIGSRIGGARERYPWFGGARRSWHQPQQRRPRLDSLHHDPADFAEPNDWAYPCQTTIRPRDSPRPCLDWPRAASERVGIAIDVDRSDSRRSRVIDERSSQLAWGRIRARREHAAASIECRYHDGMHQRVYHRVYHRYQHRSRREIPRAGSIASELIEWLRYRMTAFESGRNPSTCAARSRGANALRASPSRNSTRAWSISGSEGASLLLLVEVGGACGVADSLELDEKDARILDDTGAVIEQIDPPTGRVIFTMIRCCCRWLCGACSKVGIGAIARWWCRYLAHWYRDATTIVLEQPRSCSILNTLTANRNAITLNNHPTRRYLRTSQRPTRYSRAIWIRLMWCWWKGKEQMIVKLKE